MKNPLNLTALLLGDPNKLRFVTRYSTSMVVHKENVAEHSYYVMLYARYLCRWVMTNDKTALCEPIDTLSVLERAMFHDIDEARTGDFQRPFKYSDPHLKEMMEKAAEKEALTVIQAPLPEDEIWPDAMRLEWKHAKDTSVEGCVVALADFMAVVSYLWQESKFSSPTLSLNYDTLTTYIETFNRPWFDFLRPIIDELALIVQRVAEDGQRR